MAPQEALWRLRRPCGTFVPAKPHSAAPSPATTTFGSVLLLTDSRCKAWCGRVITCYTARRKFRALPIGAWLNKSLPA